MKKVLALLVVSIFLFGLFSLTVGAQTSEISVFALSSKDSVSVSVATSSAYGGIQGVITYDSNILEYKSATVNNSIASKNSAELAVVKQEDGKLTFVLIGDVQNGTSGEWFSLNFVPVNDNPAKTSVLISNTTISSVDGKTTNTVVGLEENIDVNVMVGDVNNDKCVDLRDLVRFKKYQAESSVEFFAANADCDGNGKFEPAIDMVALVKILLFK